MKQILLNVLNTFGYPVFLQGSLGENDPFPPAFFTFYINDSADISFDNTDEYCTYQMQVIFYANDPMTVREREDAQSGVYSNGRGRYSRAKNPRTRVGCANIPTSRRFKQWQNLNCAEV